MKQGRTKDWVRLVPSAVLTMNSQRSSSTGFTPHELFHGGRPAWFFKTPFPEDFKSPVGDWLEHKQSLANQAGTNLRHIRDREQSRRNRLRRPSSFKVGDLVLVHHSRLPPLPRNCLQDPYFGPYRIIRIDGSRIHVRCSPRLGGELLCAPKQLRHCYHKEGPYQDRPPLCPFRLLPLLIYSGSTIAFLKLQGPNSKNIENKILLQP